MDWQAALTIAIGAFTTVFGPLAALYLRLLDQRHKRDAALADAELKRIEAETKRAKDESADERRSRREKVDEMKFVIDALREDREADRKVIHDFRNDIQDLRMQIARCELERDITVKELRKHGIVIPPLPGIAPHENNDA